MTTEAPPTLRQLEVLRTIHQHEEREGYAITIREIADKLGIASTNGVADHLRLLMRKGLLTRARRLKARTLQLTPAGRRAVG